MTDRPKRRQSLPRRMFRWCRIGALLVILGLVTLILWSNYVGVPEFVAAPLRAELRRNNVSLEFGRLRLSGFQRLIAEGLSITPVAETNESRIEISRAQLVFRHGNSLREPLAISGLRLNGGRVNLRISEPGAAARFFSITNLHANVEFQRKDTLHIVDLSGEILGAKAEISGNLQNFSQFRLAETPASKAGAQWRRQLAEVMDIAEQLTFPTTPELTFTFNADAADLSRTRAAVSLRADEGVSRWGGFRRLRLNSAFAPLTNEPAIRGTFTFDLSDLGSDALNLATLRLNAETKWSSDMQQLITNHVSVAASTVRTKWLSVPDLQAELASSARKEGIVSQISVDSSEFNLAESRVQQPQLNATLQHPLPFPAPARFLSSVLSSLPTAATNRQPQEITGRWSFQSGHASLPRTEAESVIASGEISTKIVDSPLDPSLSFWEFLHPFDLPWQMQITNLTAGDAQIGNLAARGNWTFPRLDLTELKADLYQGKLNADASIDVTSRRLTASGEALFDYHQAAVLLDPPVQKWLDQFAWEHPPLVKTQFGLQLPPWTNSWENVGQTVLAGLTMNGNFQGRGSFRSVPLGLAESHFTFTNFVWSLPDLRITRPEGKASIAYVGNVTNQEISASIQSEIDPAILSSAFDKELQPAFTMLRFSTPPLVRAEIRGDLDDFKTVFARGTVMATNFFAKEQAMTDLRTAFFYSNQVIELTELVAHRGKEEVRAPYSRIDIPQEVMFVTNVISTIDPYIAMSLVGDDAYDAIDPYRFANTPTVTVNGFVPLQHVNKANLHFGVSGTDFTFWRFHLPALSGDVYWKAHELNFSNVHAAFYQGSAEWSAYFVIDDATDSARFSFHATAANASLQPLVRDLFASTNRLEGTFSGELTITSANTASIQTWNGFGRASLKDGYLWSVPVFGIFSPTLDGIAPGLGSAPINSGSGTFTITNSVIYTRDLQVRSPAFRLDYKGNVDLDGDLDARVDAELLRDTWVVGKLFSTALWPVSKIFEAKVTGTLNEPKSKFRYVPKFVFAPFKVLGAIGEAAKKREQKNQKPPPETPPPPP
jgi:hypothetical protein